MRYSSATLSATFEYPASWKMVNERYAYGDYHILFEDSTWPSQQAIIIVGFSKNPERLSLADYYRRNTPGGEERYAGIQFRAMVNLHGVRFEQIREPYTLPCNNYTLDAVQGDRIYGITRTISVAVDDDCKRDAKLQKIINEYDRLVNTFQFTR